jgi:organic radical activating enzyme
MNDIRMRHNIPNSFFTRYFIRNAENRFVNDLKRFMLWREGYFPNPQKKLTFIKKFLENEIKDFYADGKFHIPQIGFALTTRCTLLCKDCIALSPMFNTREGKLTYKHVDLQFKNFQQELNMLTESVDSIKRLFLHGGEPLMNQDLIKIVESSAENVKVELIEIITNGTIVPQKELLDSIEKYKHKIYFAMNNYYKNPMLKNKLKTDKIFLLLDERGIKHPLNADLMWYRETPLIDQKYSQEQIEQLFESCWCKHSLQIMDGKISICPRASIGVQLGLVETPEDDYIDLAKQDSPENLRKKLINFYNKTSYAACGFCIQQNELVEPAIQIDQ